MRRRIVPLIIQILLFLMITLLGIATGYLTGLHGRAPAALELLRRWSLPVGLSLLVLIVGLMVWQHWIEQRANEATPEWNSDRLPFPGLEAFTEEDEGIFFGRDGPAGRRGWPPAGFRRVGSGRRLGRHGRLLSGGDLAGGLWDPTPDAVARLVRRRQRRWAGAGRADPLRGPTLPGRLDGEHDVQDVQSKGAARTLASAAPERMG
jgi:hypothetical protein